MSEEIISCSCGHKMIKSTLYKTNGHCPKCNKLLSKAIKAEMTE